ncbi:DUF1273 domain-containing protein [Shouchella shacheensis]|uniref:DUF1273 domain-containing protein n=1 Tax=Shouchella shacheensis TaxID=1649580 RepID=UPI0009EB5DFD|nr:DUF1273 domain-containing protein [Shouchella shacheensis]
MKSLVVTGYKAQELGIFNQQHPGINYIKKTIHKRLLPLIDEGLEWIIISGQLGVEQWAGEVVLSLKEEYPQLKLAMLLPFEHQEQHWREEAKESYERLLHQADFCEPITKRPYENPGQLKQKNDFLIQKTDGLLVLYDEEKEGSPLYYLRAAKAWEKPVLLISPDEVEEVVREEQEERDLF